MKRFDVVVVGAGAFGTTLASVLTMAGRKVLLWTRRQDQAKEINEKHTNDRYLQGFELPKKLIADTDLAGAVRSTDIVLMVVPSKYFRPVAKAVGEVIQGDQILVHATKGILWEEVFGKGVRNINRMSQLLRAETPALKIGVISGPNLAREIMAKKPAGAVVASRFDEVILRTQALFDGSLMRIYQARDVVGVEIGGAFKNIIALAAGAVDGLELGDNIKAMLLTRGLNEMTRFGLALGAKPLTFLGLAGIGDLMATCASRLSRNNQVGFKLAKGLPLDQIQAEMNHVAEGVTTTKAVMTQAMGMGLDLHVVAGVHKVLYEGFSVHEAMAWMLSGKPGKEIDFQVRDCQ